MLGKFSDATSSKWHKICWCHASTIGQSSLPQTYKDGKRGDEMYATSKQTVILPKSRILTKKTGHVHTRGRVTARRRRSLGNWHHLTQPCRSSGRTNVFLGFSISHTNLPKLHKIKIKTCWHAMSASRHEKGPFRKNKPWPYFSEPPLELFPKHREIFRQTVSLIKGIFCKKYLSWPVLWQE